MDNISDRYLVLAVYCLGVCIQLLCFGDYMLHPNDHMVAYGGDPLVIYTDMLNHICHGDGVHLSFMNYPYGESIFMTDMQASFTLIFQWIHNNVVELCDVVPGLVHGVILILMPLTGVFIFKIFRNFGVAVVLSLVFSILIAYMSPQIFRFRGQLSLVYPFLIPMSIYWFVDMYDRSKFALRDLLYGFVLLFFTLNNAYIGLVGTTTLLGAGLLLMMSNDRGKGLRIFLGGFLPLVFGYLIIHFTDPFDDRLKLQWGAFYYNMSFQGLFYPKGSFLHEIINNCTELKSYGVGKRNNLGSGNIILWGSLIVLGIRQMIKREFFNHINKKVAILFGAGILALLYAMNSELIPNSQDFLEKYFSKVMMFKASGRLAWITYYIIGIVGVVLLDKAMKRHEKRWLYGLAILVALLYSGEVTKYLRESFSGIHNENHLKSAQIDKDLAKLNLSEYEAIYTLPPMQQWNDKIRIKESWSAQYSSLILSANTGLPLINSLLSRAPVNSMATAIAISSHPVLPKTRLKILPQQKPILLLKGTKYKPTDGEQYLLDHSTYVGKFLKSNIYRLDSGFDSKKPILPATSGKYTHISYDDNHEKIFMIGGGSLPVNKHDQLIYKTDALEYSVGTSLEVSFWYFVDNKSYHQPVIHLSNGKSTKRFTGKYSRDYYNSWRKQKVNFDYNGGELSISSSSKVDFVIDELHIQASQDTTFFETKDGVLFYNGYPAK